MYIKLGHWGVTESSEARYAEISREMVATGDLIHPKLMGIGHYHKPPFTYWITAFAYKLFGLSPFAARFFLQIAVFIQTLLVYKIGCLLFANKNKAVVSAAIYISMPLVIVSNRALTTDAYLCTFVVAAIYYYLKFHQTGKSNLFFAYVICIAFGFLVKGPVVLIVPIVVAIYFLYRKKRTAVKTLTLILSISVGLVISLTWFVLLITEDKAFLDYFIIDHLYTRFTDASNFHRSKPFWFYLVILPLTTFPWLIYIGYVFTKHKFKKASIDFNTGLLLAWIVIPLLFFSMSSSKLILYVLPLCPAIALLAGKFMMEDENKSPWKLIQYVFQIVVLTGLLLYMLMVYGISQQLMTILLSGLLLLVMTVIYFTKIKSDSLKMVIMANIFTLGLTIICTFIFEQNPLTINSTTPISDYIKENQLRERNIFIYNRRLPSLPFDLNKNVISIADGHHSLVRETQFEKDEQWKNELVLLSDTAQCHQLSILMHKKAVLIAKDSIPKNRNWLVNGFKKPIRIGHWIIFTN